MHQYQVKIHYHHPVGDYFARDMWKWHEGVWGEEVSFSKLDYFGVEGLLVYDCGLAMSSSRKETGSVSQTNTILSFCLKGMCEKSG